MSKADREVARTIKAFREFVFKCPKGRAEKQWRLVIIRWWGGVVALVVCTLILAIFMR